MAKLRPPINGSMLDKLGNVSIVWRRYWEQFFDSTDADSWFGTKDLADLGTKNHDDLDNKAWSVAGHTIDESVDFDSNKAVNLPPGTDPGDSTNYAQLDAIPIVTVSATAPTSPDSADVWVDIS